MDNIGKEIATCTREKCYAPFGKQPMKVHNITGVCKYCTKNDDKLASDVKSFEIQESVKIRKTPKPIKLKTSRQIKIETTYRKVQEEILSERSHCCEGCGRSDKRITFSHRISRARRRDLVTVKENIDLMCLDCHEKVELGLFSELLNGESISSYIKRIEPELYWLQFHKNKTA